MDEVRASELGIDVKPLCDAILRMLSVASHCPTQTAVGAVIHDLADRGVEISLSVGRS